MIIGYTTGVFDLFHVGHLNILKRAREQCDFLIVGVSTDELVEQYKNKRPVICYQERMEIVKAIRYVDRVVPQTSRDKLAAWKEHRFDKMFVGDDWTLCWPCAIRSWFCATARSWALSMPTRPPRKSWV